MIDTIRLKFPITPTRKQLKYWIRKQTTTGSGNGRRNVYIYNHPIGKTKLRFTYYPSDFTGSPLFSLELSLPKLLFDNNYQMISSIDGAIKMANLLLDGIRYVPKIDIEQGLLIRLDFCYNHQVGDAVDDYIIALGNLDYPHRRTKFHRYEGAEYRAKHITTKFYNKERETGISEAYGILRQETTILGGRKIKKILKNDYPTLYALSPELIKEELTKDLEYLGLLNNSIATRDTAFEKLCEAHGELAGFYYWALLNNKLKKSRKKIAKESKMHPRSIDRKLRKILETGIPLTVTEREEPLPPLKIEL